MKPQNTPVIHGLLVALAILLGSAPSGPACSRIFWNDNGKAMVIARSMDLFKSDEARLTMFPRGVERDGLPGDANSLKWKSKYGSVGIVCYGRATADGINEKGLDVNFLYLSGTVYPERDSQLPGVDYCLWPQYLLDTCATVQEALEAMKTFEVVATEVAGQKWPLHLSLADATGDSAIIEFIDGKPVVHHGREYCVMTNEPSYDEQLANLKKYRAFGGTLPLPGESTPLDRFVRASAYLKNLPQPAEVDEALAGVYSVARTTAVPFGTQDPDDKSSEDVWPTLWFSLADLTNRAYYFQSTRSPNLYWVELKELPLAEGGPVRSMDAYDTGLSGDVSGILAKQPPKK